MKKLQQGFTLIELMIAIAIISFLVSTALPAYQNYVARAQVAEGITLSGPAKLAVAEYFQLNGDWPKDNAQAGLADMHDLVGKYTEHISVESNVIEIKYGREASAAIFDQEIELTAVYDDGTVAWTCAAKGKGKAKGMDKANGNGKAKGKDKDEIPSENLPASCR